jgi:hypothetical protein
MGYMESGFYAEHSKDTIFFAGLATKKTKLKKLCFYIGSGQTASAQLWCINNPGCPKSVQVVSALLCQVHECQGILDVLLFL